MVYFIQMDAHNLPFIFFQKRLIVFLAVGFFSLLFAINTVHCAQHKPKEIGPLLVRQGEELTVPNESPLRQRLVISPVKELDSPHTVIVPGVVEADPSYIVNILPPLTGRLTQLKVTLGDVVKEGQLLAVIDAPDLDQAYADVQKARDAVELASKALNRARNVYDIGGNAVKDVEQFKSSFEQAEAEYNRAEARLKILVSSTDNNAHVLGIIAPISGTVTALNSGIGSYLTDPTAILMTISNLDNIWVTAHLPENLLMSVANGQMVDVYLAAYPGHPFQGAISFINVLLEPDTHRAKARIAFHNPDGSLKPNMYANVSIEVPQLKQIFVPTSALLMNNDTTTVFVETAPWTFFRRVVELGTEDGENVRILSGLSTGERVVIRGGVLLND